MADCRNPLVSSVIDPGEGRDDHKQQQQNRHAHQEQEVIGVAEAISSKTNDSTGPPPPSSPPTDDDKSLRPMENAARMIRCREMPVKKKFSSPVESKPSPDHCNLDTGGPRNCLHSVPYSVRLKNDVETQIGLFNGILDYQNLYGKSPFDNINSMRQFLIEWFEVDEPLESIVSAIDDLRIMRYSNAVAVDNDLEKEAFLLAQRIWTNGSDKSVNAASGDGAASLNHMSLRMKEEKDNISLKLLQFLAGYIEEIGVNPLESDTLMEDFIENHVPTDISVRKCKEILLSVKKRYEQHKSAGKIRDPDSISVEERRLMKLADDVWCDEMEIADISLGKDHSNSVRPRDSSFSIKILEAILFYREAMLINPIENETIMDDVLISVNIDMARKECNELLASIRVVYENAKAAGLLIAGDDSIPTSEMQILRLADCVWGDKNQIANDLLPYATDTRLVYDATPLSVVYPEQLEQPPMCSASIGNQSQGGCKRDVSLNRKGKKKVYESSSENEQGSTETESVNIPMHHNSIQFIDLHNDITKAADSGKYEDEDRIRLELLQSLADYVEEMGVDPLVSDTWMEKFIENHVQTDISVSKYKEILFRVKQRHVQLKLAGKIKDPDSMPVKERELMKLADDVWHDMMQVQNQQEDEAEEDSEEDDSNSAKNQ